jgi:hypothetical protein
MAVMISGKLFWLWRAVDREGEVLDLLVQRRRNKAAAIVGVRPRPESPQVSGSRSSSLFFHYRE